MDHVEDVERLFSWLKAPMVHYREFAPQREIAEAVRTWPVAHRAAAEAGMAAADEPAPRGDTAAKERAARDRMSLPIGHAPAETPAEEPEMPPSEAVEIAGFEATEPPSGTEPAMAGSEQPAAPLQRPATPRPEEHDSRHAEPGRHYPAPDRGALFSGEYRGRDRGGRPGSPPESPIADRQDRSLDAVFSRLAGGRNRLPDPRARARTSPGLGAVFGRLR